MKKILICNWKTYLTLDQAIALCEIIAHDDNIIAAPAMPHLAYLAKAFPVINISAQDISSCTGAFGAYTGETPVSILQDIGIDYAIIGHSERRSRKLDNKDTILAKLEYCLAGAISPIICVGESNDDRKNGRHLSVVRDQLQGLPIEQFAKVIIAYEPTWSVGTGTLPSLAEIQETMLAISSSIKSLDNNHHLVYGGSVSAENAKDIITLPGVSGLLVGKAATDAVQLRSILDIIEKC